MNHTGEPGFKRVVVDGISEESTDNPNIPEDFEVHIKNGVIVRVCVATGEYDFVKAGNTFIVLEA